MRVLVTEPIAPAGIELLQLEVEVEHRPVKAAELLEIVGDYDALITRNETKVGTDVLSRGKRLRVVGRAGIGVDNIDVEAATERGIVVVNVPGGNTIAATEHTFGLMLALSRHIQAAGASLRAGQWQRSKYVGSELYGKTLGIIGLGRIGSEVATRARAFGMKVIAHDPYVPDVRAAQLGVALTDLATLLREADYVTLHCAKTRETVNLIGTRQLALMKKGARLINCARGGLVDEEALFRALQSGHLAGAALDVFAQEPPGDSPLLHLPNVVVTPHLGGNTSEAQEANGVLVAEQVLRVLRGELVPEAVNLPAMQAGEAKVVGAYLPLAEVLGSFLAQAFGGAPIQLEIDYRGDLAALPTALLTNTAIKGYLSAAMGESVNYINATNVARRRGIEIGERRSSDGGRGSSMTVKVFTSQGAREVTGGLGRDGGLRFYSVNGLDLDLRPSRFMIVTRHSDRPGMIGKIGSALGEARVNIAGMQLGRQSRHGEAVMVMTVDDAPGEATLAAIAAVDGIIEARVVVLTQVPHSLREE